MFPADCKYTKNHEFLKPLGDGTAIVGITNYAQEALGDVVFVDLPAVGEKFGSGDEFGTVESVKTVSECFLPSAGEVIAINADLEAHPEYVNEDPIAKGWMIKIRLEGAVNPELLDAKAYEAHVATESH